MPFKHFFINQKKQIMQPLYLQVLVVVLAFTLMVVLSYYFMSNIEHDHMIYNVNQEIAYTQAMINSDLMEPETLIGSVAETIRDMLINNEPLEVVEKFITGLRRYISSDERLLSSSSNIYGYFDVFGGLISDGSGFEMPEGYIPEERPWYKAAVEAEGKIGVTGLYLSASLGDDVMTFARRIFDEKGNPIGIICLDMTLDRIKKYAIETYVRRGGYGILFDSDRNILAHPDPNYVGRTLSDINNGAAMEREIVERSELVEFKTTNYQGEPSVVFAKQLDNGWYLAIMTYSNEYYYMISRIARILIALGVILTIIVIVILSRIVADRNKSDERIRAILNFMPLSANIWNSKYELIDCNDETLRLFNVSDKDEFFDNFKKLSPQYQPDGSLSKDKSFEIIKEAFEKGNARVEWVHQNLKEEAIPCDITLIRIKLHNEYFVATYMQDLRELKAASAKMREADERTQIMLDSMPMGADFWSKDGDLLDCNQESLRLFGLSSKQEYIEKFYALSPEYQPCGRLSADMVKECFDKAYIDGKYRFEWEHQSITGEPIPCEITLVSVNHRGNDIIAGYIQDLRELRAAIAKMREADERTQIIFNTAPIGCLMFDKDFKILDCNDEIVNLFEIPDKKIYGRRFFDLSPEYQPNGRKSKEMVAENNEKVFREGYDRFEWMHQTLSGKPIPCEIIQVRVKYKDDYAIASYIIDLREQKILLNKLNKEYDGAREMVYWYESILDTIPFPISVTDTDLNWTFINKASETSIGKTRDEIIGLKCTNWGHPICDTENCSICRLKQGVKTTFFAHDSITFQVDAEVLTNLKGEATGYVKLLQDITELEQTTKRQAEAEAASLAKSTFLARVSHEVRTPMNAILGITEIQLQKDGLPQDLKEAFSTIYNSGYLLLGIINDILDLSKIEAGKLELSPVNYDVASLINDTVHLNVMRFDSKPIEFALYVDENVPSTLFGDDLRIKQILNNLLSNAFKYTDSGTISFAVQAEKSAHEKQMTLIFKVSDTGKGLSKEQIDRLFEEYTRFNNEANRTTIGTGLGMTITRYLVDMMNGEVLVESELDKGSIFTVRLPQLKVDEGVLGRDLADNLQTFRIDRVSSLKKAPQIVREYMPYGSVLIVDDVETNLYVAKGLMSPYGLAIETASSGFEAVEKIKRKSSYDIIFMDHFMPKMDGMEAVKIIRSLGYDRTIIALTANALAGQAEIFLANGFDGFISKPVDIRQLNSTLNKYIREQYPDSVVEEARQAKKIMAKVSAQQTVLTPELAGIFTRDAEKAVKVLEAILDKQNIYGDENIQTYIINVHAMKSALANIGERELSDFARRLEQAGREKDIALMTEETLAFLNALRSIIGKIKPKDEAEEGEIVDISAEDTKQFREKLMQIKTACEEYNKKTAKDILAELRQKKLPYSLKEALDTISEHLLHSEFENAAEVASALLKD